MSREILFVSEDSRITALERKIDELVKMINVLIEEKQSIGDWINEKQAMILTGLGKTSLTELRNGGKVRSSTLTDRKIFFRRSDFEKLLENNQK